MVTSLAFVTACPVLVPVKPRRCVKMENSSQAAVLRIPSFAGLRISNALDLLTAKPDQDFFCKVNLSLSSRKAKASRCVTKAMFERFNPKAIKVIMLSQEEARRLGHNFVGTEQILLGLIEERTGIAARVLKSMGITLEECRVEVEKIIGRGSGFVAVEIPFTPRAKRVLELSLEEARQLGHNYIGPEHLLLGLLREGKGVAARVLENLGVDLSNIRTQVLRMLVKNKEANTDENSVTKTMFDRFTRKAIMVIMLAQEEARSLDRDTVGSEQMLLGLIGEGTGTAAKVLKSMGITLEDCRVEVKKIIGRGSGVVAKELFTPCAKRVLKLSKEEARQRWHNYIGTEHLLLALLRERESVAVRVLENLSADPIHILAQVLSMLGENNEGNSE